MLRYTSTTHFLDHMFEVEHHARDGYAGMAVDYSEFDTGDCDTTRDYAYEKFASVRRLVWFEGILILAFQNASQKEVGLWWLLRARRLSRKNALESGLCPFGRTFLKSAGAGRLLDRVDQLLVDELAMRGLLTYC